MLLESNLGQDLKGKSALTAITVFLVSGFCFSFSVENLISPKENSGSTDLRLGKVFPFPKLFTGNGQGLLMVQQERDE